MNGQSYVWVQQTSSEIQEIKKDIKKSLANIDIDFETGDFSGNFGEAKFEGKFNFKHTSAGFVKGFIYTLDLAALSRQVMNQKGEEEFFDFLSSANRIYIYPDILARPELMTIEMSSEKSDKDFVFLKILKDSE